MSLASPETAPAQRADPIAAARAVARRFDFVRPKDIQIELVAYVLGACTLEGKNATADARVLRDQDFSYLVVDPAVSGVRRARFSVAHELGHHLLHPDRDAVARVHSARATEGREFHVEREANRFAAHVLVPDALARARCEGGAPSLDRVARLADEFEVSLSVAAQRWPEMTTLPCACVESRGANIRVAVRSPSFRGVALQRRALEEGTLALDLARGQATAGARVHRQAWGSGKAGREIVEECVPIVESEDGRRTVLTWLWHEAVDDEARPRPRRSARR